MNCYITLYYFLRYITYYFSLWWLIASLNIDTIIIIISLKNSYEIYKI